jgi:hypothetical protein
MYFRYNNLGKNSRCCDRGAKILSNTFRYRKICEYRYLLWEKLQSYINYRIIAIIVISGNRMIEVFL